MKGRDKETHLKSWRRRRRKEEEGGSFRENVCRGKKKFENSNS